MNKNIIGAIAGAIGLVGVVTGGLLSVTHPEDEPLVEAEIADASDEELIPDEKPAVEIRPPKLDVEAVRSIRDDLRDPPEVHGGLLGIARKHNQSMDQVKLIKRKIAEELSERAIEAAEPK